jgi:hypothetical protein
MSSTDYRWTGPSPASLIRQRADQERTRTRGKRGGRSTFGRETRFATNNDAQPYDYVRFIPAVYAECPFCHAQSKVEKRGITCWCCKSQIPDVITAGLPINPFYMAHSAYIPGTGPNKRGFFHYSRNDNGKILQPVAGTDPSTWLPRECAFLEAGVAHKEAEKARILGERAALGKDNKLESSDWGKILSKTPRLSMGFYIVHLGNWHTIQIPGEEYPKTEICVRGMRDAGGTELACNHCNTGSVPVRGRGLYWTPYAPGKSLKGHLAQLEQYIEKNIAIYGTDSNIIYPVSWNCQSCGAAQLDLTQPCTKDQLKAVEKRDYNCTVCHATGPCRKVTRTYIYGVQGPDGIVPTPAEQGGQPMFVSEPDECPPLTMFDVELCLRRVVEGNDSNLDVVHWNVIPELRGEANPPEIQALIDDPIDLTFMSKWSIEYQHKMLGTQPAQPQGNPQAVAGMAQPSAPATTPYQASGPVATPHQAVAPGPMAPQSAPMAPGAMQPAAAPVYQQPTAQQIAAPPHQAQPVSAPPAAAGPPAPSGFPPQQ